MYNVTNALSENNKDPFRSYRFKGVQAVGGLKFSIAKIAKSAFWAKCQLGKAQLKKVLGSINLTLGGTFF